MNHRWTLDDWLAGILYVLLFVALTLAIAALIYFATHPHETEYRIEIRIEQAP